MIYGHFLILFFEDEDSLESFYLAKPISDLDLIDHIEIFAETFTYYPITICKLVIFNFLNLLPAHFYEVEYSNISILESLYNCVFVDLVLSFDGIVFDDVLEFT